MLTSVLRTPAAQSTAPPAPPPADVPQFELPSLEAPDPLPSLAVWQASGEVWQMVGKVADYTSLSVEQRWRGPGMWSLSLPYGESAKLFTKTRVVTFDFRGERFTGLVERFAPQSDEKGQPILEVGGQGALALLSDPVCYPDPTAGAGAQLVTRYRDTGPAESVLRRLVLAQFVDRQGRFLYIPPSQQLGDEVTVNLFFDNLLEVMVKKAQAGGIGFRMGLVNTTTSTRARMQLSFSEGVDRSQRVRFSHKIGTLRAWKQEDTVPAATRAIVGAAITERPILVASVSGNALTTSGAHGLKTGSLIRFRGSGDPPAPLDDGTAYFAIRVDSNSFKVARTRAKALAGTVIDLTNVGTGTVKVTEVARVVGEYAQQGAEDEWGRQRETFVDARDEDTDDTTVFRKKGREALADADEQTSFDLETAEVESLRYGAHYSVGDLVTVELLTGVSTVERLSAVNVEVASDGMKVRVVPGNPDSGNPHFKTSALIRAMNRRLRNLEQEES